MGRLAGTSLAQQARETWQAQVAAARQAAAEGRAPRKRTKTPFRHLPRSRRLAALLDHISWWPDGMVINGENVPPLTADMRLLIKKGLVTLGRRDAYSVWAFLKTRKPRETALRLTDAGRNFLAAEKVTDAERHAFNETLAWGVVR